MTVPRPGPPGDDHAAPALASLAGGGQPAAADQPGRPARPPGRSPAAGPGEVHAVTILADRLAAALVHHEPGWRLPRHSALARRYNVSTAEIEAAVGELVARHLVRRLADGQLYRASPAECVIGLAGVPGLASYIDTMGGDFACRSRQVTWRTPPEDIAWALQLPPGGQVAAVRLAWTAAGEPAALCTTYVPAGPARLAGVGAPSALPGELNLLAVQAVADLPGAAGPGAAGPGGTGPDGREPGDSAEPEEAAPLAGVPSALHIELQAPPPSVARSLRLRAGQPAVLVTVRFADPGTGRPAALTVAVLRPDLFRVIVQTPQPPLGPAVSGSSPVSWAHVAEGWES